MKESLLVSSSIKWLFANGCYVWRNNSGAYKPEGTGRFIRFGKKGSADIIGLTRWGRLLAVECKSDRGKQTPEQLEFQQRIEEKKGIYILAYSVDDLEARKLEITHDYSTNISQINPDLSKYLTV